MQTLANTGLGGQVFLVSELNNFPTEACTFSLWTHQPTRLFYGNYDTGSIYDDTVTFLDISIQSGGIDLNFAGNGHYFSTGAFPLFWTEEAHHLAITLQSTPSGYAISCYANAVLIDTITLEILNSATQPQPMRLLPSGPLYIGNQAPDLSQDGQFGNLQEARGCMSELHLYREALGADAINIDALGDLPENTTPYLNLPLDDLHYDRRLGRWLDTVQPYFHAQEHIRTDNNPVIMFNGNYSRFPIKDRSVAFWIRCRAGASGTLISYGDVSNTDHPNDGGTPWILEDPSGLTLNGYGSGIQAATGDWNHVTIVEDSVGNSTTFYLNGKPGPYPPGSYMNDGVILSQPLLLGAKQTSDADDSVFTGDLIDLRFWSRPLSAEEVAEFARGVVPDATDPTISDYQPLGTFEVDEEIYGNNRVFLPMLENDVKYPLQSSLAMREVLHVGPDKGGMQTRPYTDLSGSDFTLELWAQVNTDGFLFRGLGTNEMVNVSLAKEGDRLVLSVKNAVDDQYTQFVMDTTGTELTEWHHLAFVISTTGVSGYFDGTSTFSPASGVSNGLVQLGNLLQLQFGAFGNGATAVDGSFAEIRFWNRTLAIGEIRHMMYHYLTGNEAGLVGRWAFENALGRDTSTTKQHAFPVNKPEFTELSDIDLEPLGSPYLVAQVTLMEDYHFDDDQITPRNSYRIQIIAHDGNDSLLPDLDLSISIQAEPNNPFQNTNILTEDSGKTATTPIAINQPYVMSTNAQGMIAFALPAEDLLAPVLRITAPFMLQDHALLVFPDRQAHHALAEVTEDDLLNKKVKMAADQAPRAIVTPEHRDSVSHVAKAIQNFMGVGTEKTPQSNTPVVRPVEQRLREIVTPPMRRLYENATASPDTYNPQTDVISGYAVDQGQPSISRSLSVNEMPDWSFGKDENGTFVVMENHRSNRMRNMALTENLIVNDPLTRLLLGITNERQRSDSTPSYSDLLAAIDETNRTRSFFDLFAAIRDAVSFVVQTVEHVYETIKETVRVAVVFITDAFDAVTAFAIHTVEHAVEAVKGVLAKVEATVEGAINFVKAILDWDDILETQRFNEQLLKSAMIAAQGKLGRTKTATLNWAKGLKVSTHTWLEQLKSDAAQHKSSMNDNTAPTQRTSIKGSYMQNMASDHAKDANMSDDTDVTTTPSQAQDALNLINNNNPGKSDQILSDMANLHLFSGTEFSLTTIVDRLIDLLEVISDNLFDMLIAGIDWFFTQLEQLLIELDKLLATRIDIPFVTRLYEHYIMKDSGATLTLYSFGALVGAIPATILYKLATGSDHGPFHGEDLNRYRTLISSAVTVIPVNQDERTQTQISQEKASLGLGGCFLGFVAITGVFNTYLNSMPATSAKLKRIGLSFNTLFQLSQFPIGSSFNLETNPNDAPAAVEETIWAVQFFPLVLEAITASDKLTTSKEFFDKFSMVSTTLFGGLHVALFITVFALEVSQPETDKEDSTLKFVANLSSCVPELTAWVAQPVAKALISGVSATAWGLISSVRYVGEINRYNQTSTHHVFSPR
ncbi:LamG domain-containing protein [Lunatimonas salinarum]|uniref:LamG domain-containing protein n=1 Tax=Lunatimonas salinarum TaxID=1774590 RepID=UPI001ADFE6BD|nr:LamG domain-containing protein [Lunatimonas salinarum]